MKGNKAFTLLEVLLAVAIGGLVFTIVFQSVRYGIVLQKKVYHGNEEESLRIVHQLSGDLRAAFLSPGSDPALRFIGGGSSLEFVSAAPLSKFFIEGQGSGLIKKKYHIALNEQSKELNFIVVSKDPLSSGKNKERFLSKAVSKLQFHYYDGRQWMPAWQSDQDLPLAVKMELEFVDKDPRQKPYKYQTIMSLING